MDTEDVVEEELYIQDMMDSHRMGTMAVVALE